MSHTIPILIDARNVDTALPTLLAELRETELYGYDIETQDENRHPGLNLYNNNVRHVFDVRRTIITGFSIHCQGSPYSWYVNLNHADVENRLPIDVLHQVLGAATDDAICVAHNAPFEIANTKMFAGIDLRNLVCTLQMAVSHHGPDEYDHSVFYNTPLPRAFHKLVPDIVRAWSEDGNITGEAQELLGKFIAKESKAEHSYNGFVKSIAKGYSLKALTKSRFGFEQATFKDTLAAAGASHMGELTGEQVCSYGADDAYWAVQHYKWMFDEMLRLNPHALTAFFKQENPMVLQYAEAWMEGIRLDLKQVFERQRLERIAMAAKLRELKAVIRSLLPFKPEPHPKLVEKESWYEKNWQKKRSDIALWAVSADSDDDFEQVFQVSNPIGNAWAAEKGMKVKPGKLNLVYYQTMRTIIYDLLGAKVRYSEGSVASDAEARGKIRETMEAGTPQLRVMELMQDLAEIEQRMKLYLTPYTLLMDPETSRVYPSLSSQLATRRLATSFPNPMQLAKSGSSAYIRSFYLGDDDDCVVVSADWSAIELVLIGDFSGDPGFAEVYGQIPYGDMHSGAAVDALKVKTLPGLTEEEFREFKFNRNPNGRQLVNFAGVELSPKDYHKFARGTAVGKGVNFSYWYSGALSTVANNLGLSDDEHWELVDNYRARFPVAEAYRVGIQDEAATYGYVVLPDGHRRNRFEATWEWQKALIQKMVDITAAPGMVRYAETAARRLSSRAKNQAVNAVIQGTCATLAKRSILRIVELCREAGLGYGVGSPRLMCPIHDELVFSVPRKMVLTFIPLLRRAMTEHPKIVSRLPLHCTVAIGRTFRPFDSDKPWLSQIELDEAQTIPGIIEKELEGTVLSEQKVADLLEWMFDPARARS